MNKSPYLKEKFALGSLNLPSNIFYAPLAGCSDFPFRMMSSRYHPGLMYCEMVKMEPLVRGEPNTLRMLDYAAQMRPIGGQICGSNPALAGKAARMVEELGFDVVDLNCGCPVDKVTKDGSGSGLLKTPERIGEIVANMVAAVKIPVTVKVRAGWDDSSINAEQVTKIAEQAGAVAICVHGRTREQGYRGNANWDYIKAAKRQAETIKVIGNGDLFDSDAVARMFEYTECDAVLISRGTMGQPWIVEQAVQRLSNEPIHVRSLDECRAALLEHFRYACAYHPLQKVVLEMRKVGCWYFKSVPGCRAFRYALTQSNTIEEVENLILNFSLGNSIAGEAEDQELEN